MDAADVIHLTRQPPIKFSSSSGGEEGFCVCLHPVLGIAAAALEGVVAEYDLASGSKLGSTETGDPPQVLRYSSDGATIIGLSKERALTAWETQFWKRKVLLQASGKDTKQCLLAVAKGSRPAIFLSSVGSREITVVLTSSGADTKAKDRQGTYDAKKGICAIAAHPEDADVVFVLQEDTAVSAWSLNTGQRSLTQLWSVMLRDTPTTMSEGILFAQGCTTTPGSILLLAGTSDGYCAMLEQRIGSAAQVFLKHEAGHRVVGAGYMEATGTALTILQNSDGEVTGRCWRIESASSSHVGKQAEVSIDPAESAGLDQEAGAWRGLWVPGVMKRASPKSGHAQALVHQHRGTVLIVENGASGPTAQLLSCEAVSQAVPQANQPASTIVHTGLEYWAGKGDGIIQHLQVQSRILHLDKGGVQAYSITDGQSTEVTVPPLVSKGQTNLQAVHLVHSLKQDLLLIFFCRADGAEGGLSWEFTALPAAGGSQELEKNQQRISWTLPGCCGTFVGLEEQHYAVLSDERQHISLFASSPGQPDGRRRSKEQKGPTPLKRVALPSPGARAIFAGPAWASLPRTDTADEIERPGSGLIMWSSSDILAISELTAPSSMQRTGLYAATGRAGAYPAHTLPLHRRETVKQAAWQDLAATSSDGSVLDDSGEGKASTVGAILTSKRLLLVSATLKVLVALSLGPSDPAITSILWMGPALLFCNTSNQVRQLSWDGSVALLCSLGGGMPASLVAALADRLLVLRGSTKAGESTISSRQLSVLEPLLHGWASLAALGVLPGGVWRARTEMSKLARAYDSSRVSSRLLGVLLTAGCADIALALSQNQVAQSASGQQAAMKAAAGDWQPAMQASLDEHKRSIFYPRAPPKGSLLWRRLVSLGRTALAYGQITAARECWLAAGNWQQLLPLCALQGDFNAIRQYASLAPAEASVLGQQLLSLSEARFQRASAVGATPVRGDWKVAPELLSGSLAAAAAEMGLQLAPLQSAPSMHTAAAPGATLTVGQLDANAIEAYLGMGNGVPWRLAASKKASAAFGDSSILDAPVDGSRASVAGTEDLSSEDGDGQRSSAPSTSTAVASAPLEAPQQSHARADFLGGKDKFYSSDSDEAQSETSSAPSRPQFKIVIRDKAETVSAGDADALRSAATNLRLSSSLYPSLTIGGAKGPARSERQERPAQPAQAPPLLVPQGRGPLPEDLFSAQDDQQAGSLTAEPAAAPAAASLVQQPPGPLPGTQKGAPAKQQALDAKTAFSQGLAEMEQGEWDAAAEHFSMALHSSDRGGELSMVAQYLTAVRLVDAQASNEQKAPSFARFAAALNLRDRHKRALIQSAAQLNMEAGNYGYAAEQLMWLVEQSVGQAPPAFLNKLQQHINECEKHGLKNADVPVDEDLQSFAEIISMAESVADVENCLAPLMT